MKNTSLAHVLSVPLIVLIVLFVNLPLHAQGRIYRPILADEFNGAAGLPPDSAVWTLEKGGQGWGNQELQYYTDEAANAFLDGKGSLVIKAEAIDAPGTYDCWYGKCKYTSARLNTKKKFELKYGRIEARIKIPRGQGIWPAFWMLGKDIDDVGWPNCGEIDIMENIGREPKTVHGTIHGPGYSGAQGIGAPYNLPDNAAFADDFHVYAVVWSKNRIKWYVDGNLFQTLTPKNLPEGERWVFDHPFFLIMNLAVGGNWPGSPDDSTMFPQEMLVDYVRVYRR